RPTMTDEQLKTIWFGTLLARAAHETPDVAEATTAAQIALSFEPEPPDEFRNPLLWGEALQAFDEAVAGLSLEVPQKGPRRRNLVGWAGTSMVVEGDLPTEVASGQGSGASANPQPPEGSTPKPSRTSKGRGSKSRSKRALPRGLRLPKRYLLVAKRRKQLVQ